MPLTYGSISGGRGVVLLVGAVLLISFFLLFPPPMWYVVNARRKCFLCCQSFHVLRSCFHLQVFNLFLPSGLQCVAPAGTHHPVLWLAGRQHPFGRVHLGCEELSHSVPGAGDGITQPTLHCCIQGNTKSRAIQHKKRKKKSFVS